MTTRVGKIALAVAVGATAMACSARPAPSVDRTSGCCDVAAPDVELTIYAAASLQDALPMLVGAYRTEQSNVSIVASTDSSAALEAKIEQGAPADVFLSADTTNPRKLFDGGWSSEPPTPFAGNELTVIVPAANPGGVASPADLAIPGVEVIAAGAEVPITSYTARVVANLASVPGYPKDFEARYAANIASREENVAAIVGKIELGQGDAAIVYVTDAVAATGVETLPVPADANVRATYAGVVLKASRNVEAARELLAWIAGPDGQAILRKLGFVAAPA